MDDAKRFSYCGGDIHEGKLRILFSPGNLGVNIEDALNRTVLLQALNDAPAPPSDGSAAVTLSFAARSDIRKEYEPKAEEIRAQIAEALDKPDIKINPNFEDTFAKLQEASKAKNTEVRGDWDGMLGNFTRLYFEGFVSQLKYQKFDEDDMLREGFHDMVEKGEIAFRIVDKLKYDSYCECEIEDGILYLQVRIFLSFFYNAFHDLVMIFRRAIQLTVRQCTIKYWGTNVESAAQGLINRL